MNSEYYIDNILSKIVKPAFDRISNAGNITERKLFSEKKNGIFQQDGARCRTSATTIRWLSENIPFQLTYNQLTGLLTHQICLQLKTFGVF